MMRCYLLTSSPTLYDRPDLKYEYKYIYNHSPENSICSSVECQCMSAFPSNPLPALSFRCPAHWSFPRLPERQVLELYLTFLDHSGNQLTVFLLDSQFIKNTASLNVILFLLFQLFQRFVENQDSKKNILNANMLNSSWYVPTPRPTPSILLRRQSQDHQVPIPCHHPKNDWSRNMLLRLWLLCFFSPPRFHQLTSPGPPPAGSHVLHHV